MLREEIAKMKKNAPAELTTVLGACKFCGQTKMIEVPSTWGGNFVDEAVTEMCDCFTASCYTSKKRKQEKAAQDIEMLFGDESDTFLEQEVRDLLDQIAESVIRENFTSVTINVVDGLKVGIKQTARGTIKIERIKTEKYSTEAV